MKLEDSMRIRLCHTFSLVTRGTEDEYHLTHRKLMYLIRALEDQFVPNDGSVDFEGAVRARLEAETATRAFEHRMLYPDQYPEHFDDREIPMYDLDDYLDIAGAVLHIEVD